MKYAAILLFLLNFITGLLFINDGLFHHDSVVLAQAVERTYATGVLQPAIKGRYGGVIAGSIVYFPFFLSGQNADFAIRFSSVLFHSLSIVALLLFINELFNNPLPAFFSSLLFSFTPFYFSPNTYGKEHGLSIFIFLFSLYLLCRGLNKKSLILIAISGFSVVLTVTVRESMLLALPLYPLLYLSPEVSFRPFKITVPQERLNLKWIAAAGIPFLLMLSFILWAYLSPVIYKALFIDKEGESAFRILPLVIRDLFVSLPIFVASFFILGVRRMLLDKKTAIALFFIIWFSIIFYFSFKVIYCPRYLDIVVIPIYLFVSYFLADLYKRNKFIVMCLVVYCVLYMFHFMYPMLVFRHFYSGPKRLSLFIKHKTEPNAVIIENSYKPFIEYYGKRKVIQFPQDNSVQGFFKKIDAYLSNKTPVYITDMASMQDSGGEFTRGFLKCFHATFLGKVVLDEYHRPELQFHMLKIGLYKVDSKECDSF